MSVCDWIEGTRINSSATHDEFSFEKSGVESLESGVRMYARILKSTRASRLFVLSERVICQIAQPERLVKSFCPNEVERY